MQKLFSIVGSTRGPSFKPELLSGAELLNENGDFHHLAEGLFLENRNFLKKSPSNHSENFTDFDRGDVRLQLGAKSRVRSVCEFLKFARKVENFAIYRATALRPGLGIFLQGRFTLSSTIRLPNFKS